MEPSTMAAEAVSSRSALQFQRTLLALWIIGALPAARAMRHNQDLPLPTRPPA